eukprot:TRINITY_DN47920_c0_g1_i1.p2 TRINITY_DN47920_c0_g1~~TRINITY_DN47920_c0_g1_i1.p2  ORF type:complete len:437 (+),score=138.09 TRINITY_DN47920_c0_g1_i1:175-1311(+)
MPRCVEDLTPAAVSRLVGRQVTQVSKRKDREKVMAGGDVTELGAGGTGTCRAWLTLCYADGEEANVFVKMPATTLMERLFLTVFRVYPNELNFYTNVRLDRRFPADLFPRVHHVSTRGHAFCLVLQDLSKQGAEFPSILADYPRRRLNMVLDTMSTLHAAFWQRPPQGVWCDQWSRKRTAPPTPAATRPPFRRFVAEHTLKEVLRRYPGLIPQDILGGYRLYIRHCETVRRAWSSGKLTLCHGDCHVGNMFFLEDRSGLYDMQCVAAEHPMRDITYHIMCSYDADALAREEKEILEHYRALLNRKLAAAGEGEELTWDECWQQYRLHGWWALAAFVISAGASGLMKEGTARACISRICTAMGRADSIGALTDLLDAQR